MSTDSKSKEVVFLAPTMQEAFRQFVFYANVICFSLVGPDSEKYRQRFVQAVNDASSVLMNAIDIAKNSQKNDDK